MSHQEELAAGVIAVPGFGFYPSKIWKLILETSEQNYTKQQLCQNIEILWEMNLISNQSNSSCPPLWDTVSCIPATPYGRTAVLPCIEQLDGKIYNKFQNMSRECSSNGTWGVKSNYSSCKLLDLDNHNHIDQSYIYLAGYSASILALLVAICIMMYFKRMRCLRHKIHINLFATFLITDFCWVLQAIIQYIETQLLVDQELSSFKVSIFCSSILLHRYFHLATFFWMFIEGLYLFLQVQATFSFSRLKFRHCITIGWGSPVLVTLLWSLLIICHPKEKHEIHSLEVNDTISVLLACPFLTVNFSIDILTYSTPVCVLLAINFFFLAWIMVVVISKLKSSNISAIPNPDFHSKAAKALLVISPLLGTTYMMTIVAPPVGEEGKTLATSIYTYIRAFVLSFQGVFITLPYCFLNGEVCQSMTNHLERWRTKREIEQNLQVEQRNSLVTFNRSEPRLKLPSLKKDSLDEGLEMANMESTMTRVTIQSRDMRNTSFNIDKKDVLAFHDGGIKDEVALSEDVAIKSNIKEKDAIAVHDDVAIKSNPVIE